MPSARNPLQKSKCFGVLDAYSEPNNRWRWWIQLIPSRTQSSVSEVMGRWIFTFFCQFPVFVLSEANWLLTVAMSLETLRKFHVWTKILTWKLTWCQMWTGLISHKNTHFYNLTIYSKLIFFTRRKPETSFASSHVSSTFSLIFTCELKF